MTPANNKTQEHQVLTVLQANAEGLLSDRAEGWEAVLLFEVTDVGPFTLSVSGGAAQVTAGQGGEPTCVVQLSTETLVGLGTGEVEGPKAFMQGLITATNMADMMRFATCFDGQKVAHLIRERLTGDPAPEGIDGRDAAPGGADGRGAAPEGAEGLNKQSVGWTYEGAPTVADLESIQAYVQATGDTNPRYADAEHPEGLVAPPMYVVRPMKETLFKPLLDPKVNANLLLLLHGEQDMQFHGLLRPGDAIQTRSQITEIIDKASGQILKMKIRCDHEGAAVAEALVTVFIRSPKKKPPGDPTASKDGAAPREEVAPQDPPAWSFEEQVTVGPEQPLRYAEASLDNNPIHTEVAVAQAAGLRTNILQGLCTMAFCQQAVIKAAADGDPGRLKRLKVRFAQPVFPGDTLMIQGHFEPQPDGQLISERRLTFRVINQAGGEVITSGEAEVRVRP